MTPSVPHPATVAQVGEFALIDTLIADLPGSPAISVGPGDDATVFLVNGSAVESVDLFVEGVHFRRDWSEPFDVGRKVVAASVADLEAMGASPITLLVGLAVPRDLPEVWVAQFAAGLRAEAERAGLTLAGGDVSQAIAIMISATVTGQTDDVPPVRRSGAQAGQLVAVRGRLGWAGAGLSALARGFRSPKAVVDEHRCPTVPYGAGRIAVAAGAGAMIDVSDGLLADLGHVAQASDVVIALESARLEVAEPVAAVAAATGANPLDFVLTGGEDHALVATFDLGDVPEGWVVIGRVEAVAPDGHPAVTVDGAPWDTSAPGWTHF